MNYTRHAVVGAMWVFIFLIVSAVAGYLMRLVLARSLTVAEFGLFYSAYALIQILIIFRDFGLRNALAKFIPEFVARMQLEYAKGTIIFVFFFHLFTSLIFTAAVVLLSPFLAANYFHAEAASRLMMVYSVVFLTSFIEEVFVYSLQGFQKMLPFSAATAVRMVTALLLTIILLNAGAGIAAPVIAFIITYVITSVIYFVIFLKSAFPNFIKAKMAMNLRLSEKLLKFGGMTMLTLVGGFILVYTDTIMLTYFRSLTEVGWYQAAMPTTTLLWYVGQAIAAAMLPLSSELWATGKLTVLRAGIELAHKYAFAVVMPMALAMLAFPEIIIRLLFGEAYLPGAVVMQVLAAGAIIYSISMLNTAALSGIGRPEAVTKITFIAAAANLILNFIFIPFYGITGAAVATAISYGIMTVLSTMQLKSEIGIKEPWTNWIKTTAAGAVFILTVYFLKAALEMAAWPEAFVCLAAASVLYVTVLLALRVVGIREMLAIVARARE